MMSSCVAAGSQTKSRWKSGNTVEREWISPRSSLRARGLVSSKMLTWASGFGLGCGLGCRSSRLFPSGEQLGKTVVDAIGVEVRLTPEGLAQVSDSVRVAIEELDHGEDVVLWLVERIEDLVAGHA